MSADARALLMQRLAGESLPAPPPLPGSAGAAPGGLTPPQQVRPYQESCAEHALKLPSKRAPTKCLGASIG